MVAKKKRPSSRKTKAKAKKAMKPQPKLTVVDKRPAKLKWNEDEAIVILDSLRYLPLNGAAELLLCMPDGMVRAAVANMPVARTDNRCVTIDNILRKTAPPMPEQKPGPKKKAKKKK